MQLPQIFQLDFEEGGNFLVPKEQFLGIYSQNVISNRV